MIKSIRTLSLPVPTRSENFNLFFQSLERAFLTKKINDEYKSEILINLLGERAHNVLLYIKEEELNDYEKLKSIVLREFQLTPRECLNSFKNAVKSSGETYIQFAARLTANFQYYCSLRKVNSFESLCDLIISDKLFETLNKLKLSIIREKCSDIVLCKKVNGAMKTSSVEFISRSPTPLPMKSEHRRFVLLRKIFEPWQWKRRKKRNRFEQTSRTLERKISMRSTKELIKKDVLMPDGSDKDQDSRINDSVHPSVLSSSQNHALPVKHNVFFFPCGTFLMSKRCLHMMEKLFSSAEL
ncbi:uncharacterized protein TNCV_4963661 [Trichonephila clavipes]|nr:uncharacterized protein TNCV_4963661 [Trichonephila clavipes]